MKWIKINTIKDLPSEEDEVFVRAYNARDKDESYFIGTFIIDEKSQYYMFWNLSSDMMGYSIGIKEILEYDSYIEWIVTHWMKPESPMD